MRGTWRVPSWRTSYSILLELHRVPGLRVESVHGGAHRREALLRRMALALREPTATGVFRQVGASGFVTVFDSSDVCVGVSHWLFLLVIGAQGV